MYASATTVTSGTLECFKSIVMGGRCRLKESFRSELYTCQVKKFRLLLRFLVFGSSDGQPRYSLVASSIF